MGLYDEVVVEYPLPDGFDATGHVFQTKDTPEQDLHRYILRADGTLVTAQGEVECLHGPLTFYTSNWCAGGPWGYATRDDQPAWEAEYTALYAHGRLLTLEGGWRLMTQLHGEHLTQTAWQARAHARVAAQGQEGGDAGCPCQPGPCGAP